MEQRVSEVAIKRGQTWVCKPNNERRQMLSTTLKRCLQIKGKNKFGFSVIRGKKELRLYTSRDPSNTCFRPNFSLWGIRRNMCHPSSESFEQPGKPESQEPLLRGLQRGLQETPVAGGVKRLFSFVRVCSRLLAIGCV